MKVHCERVSFAGTPDALVFAAVQLQSPALKRISSSKTFKWDPEQEPLRLNQALEILNRVALGDLGTKPHIVIFPEYSLPQSAFDGNKSLRFQEVADRERCIIVAGSYFDADDTSDYYRCNICKVYIPARPEPIVLNKSNPARDEQEYVVTKDELPTSARLVWEVVGRQPISISIFLCRDYLAPFETRASASPDDQELERISLLDWERMGINIVVMENEGTSLFEAAAAMDVRRIHGEHRKLVLFVNSASGHKKLATAILGPHLEEERVRDVAVMMPPDVTGVLLVETNLQHVAVTKDDPDPTPTVPIKHWDRFELVNDDKPQLVKIQKDDILPIARGVYHPALLSVLEKFIVIEIFVARSTQHIQEAFHSGRIKHVTASHVRGVEDILVRRYIESSLPLANPGKVPSISQPHDVPFVKLAPDEFAKAFEIGPHAPFLRALIEPKSIRKFRGKWIEEIDEGAWSKLCAEIRDSIHPHRDSEAIVKFASELSDKDKIPTRFSSVFLGEEKCIPTGQESGIRETYLFLVCETLDGKEAKRNFLNFARNKLADDDSVRDLFTLTLVDVNPPVHRVPLPFQFLLRLKCTVFEADSLIDRCQQWARQNELRVGTRSYDVWRGIIREATQGIVASTMSREQIAFQKALCTIDPNFVFESREIAEAFARSSMDHNRLLDDVQTDDWRDLKRELSGFFHYVSLYNSVKPINKKKSYSIQSCDRWNGLYRYLEIYCGQLLASSMKIGPEGGRSAIAERLKELNKDYFKTRGSDSGLVKWFADFYGVLEPAKASLARLVEKKQGLVLTFRNLAVHGQVAEDLNNSIKISGSEWRENFDALNSRVDAICELLVVLSKELHVSGAE